LLAPIAVVERKRLAAMLAKLRRLKADRLERN